MPSRHCSLPWPSWRPGTSALPCSTVKRPSWRQREHSLTLHSSTFCTFPMTRSLPSTYHSSCPCACLFCCHCSKSCLRLDGDAEKSKPRRTENKKKHIMNKQSVTFIFRYKVGHEDSVMYDFFFLLFTVNCMIVMNGCCDCPTPYLRA